MKKIYLSAPGLICCAGQNKEELYDSCLRGDRSGMVIRELQGSHGSDYTDGGKFPTGQIPWSLPTDLPDYIENNRVIHIIDAALEQIRPIIDSAISAYSPEEIGVCLGSCYKGYEGSVLAHKEFLSSGSFPEDYRLRFQSASFPAEFAADKFGLKGPVLTFANACASGASAIIKGAELIRAGLCKAVIAGGADNISNTALMGFHALKALSECLSNPFSINRKGINLGEGAAFFLLDSVDRDNYGIELLGAGENADAYHMTAPGPDGEGPVHAMKAALLDAGLESSQIAYVNLHGTGTELNDIAEALAMKAVFGDKPPAASSTKPITGHTLGAAGALEAAICWMVLTAKKGFPLHCWDGERDPELVFIPEIYDSIGTAKYCMSNSFAFGGCNASLILGRRS